MVVVVMKHVMMRKMIGGRRRVANKRKLEKGRDSICNCDDNKNTQVLGFTMIRDLLRYKVNIGRIGYASREPDRFEPID